MTELVKRSISGAVFVAGMVACILYNDALFAGLSATFALAAVREYHRLTHPFCWMDLCAELSAMLLCFTVYHLSLGQTASVSYILPVYILLMLVSIIGELWDKSGNPLANWGNLFIGQVMIALPFALMNTLNVQSHLLLLAVFVLIWVNDTGAYCVGSLTAKRPQGNHKMFPRVSPKKSWEGLFGGIALAVGAGALLARFGWFDGVSECICPYITGIVFALVVSVFGTLGDLVESLIKRTVGVKDSGTFLPGHGGVLDRFDSVLLAAPASLLFLQILALFE